MTRFRRLISVAGWLLCIAFVLVIWPAKFGGWASQTIVSGESMEPTYYTGDLVLGWKAATYSPGDIVVYTVPKGEVGAGYQIIHRLVSVDEGGQWTVRGDNKSAADPWTPTADDIVGKAAFVIPGAGSFLQWLPLTLAIVAGVLVTAGLWPRRPADEEDEDGRDEDSQDATALGTSEPAMPEEQPARSAPLIRTATGIGVALLAFTGGLGSASTLGGIQAESITAWSITEVDALDLPCRAAAECAAAQTAPPPETSAGSDPGGGSTIEDLPVGDDLEPPGSTATPSEGLPTLEDPRPEESPESPEAPDEPAAELVNRP